MSNAPPIAAEAAAQSASWFFEHARDLFGVLSSSGVFQHINPAWTAVTGWAADELIGHNLLEFLHEESREPVIEMGRRLAKDGDVPCEMRLRCKDGGWVWLEGYVRRGPNGEMIGMQRDVTEQRARAEALREAEQIQHLLSETAGVGLWRFDPRVGKLEWSHEWSKMLEASGVRMETPEEFVALCHPEDYPRVYAATEACVLTGRSDSFVYRLKAGDGRWMSIRIHLRGAPIGDGLYVAHGIGQDITALVQAREAIEQQNERLELAMSAARAAVIEVDYERREVWCSPEFVEQIGYAMSFEQAALSVWPCVLEEFASEVEETVRQWLAGGVIAPMEVRVRLASGAPQWVRIFTDIHRNESGRISRTISLLIDIDEQKRQQLALVAAEQTASAATEAKSQFLANMSHELRTPMNGVLGILHLLKTQALSAEAADLVDEALSCGGMLQALLDDIVDFSRIEAGRLELSEEPVDPAALVQSVAGMLRRTAEAKGLAFDVQIEGLPPLLLADPVRLRQCLFNLIGNAVKFTERGEVAVSARAVAEGTRLRLEVRDTGIGIPEDILPLLFERFRQADASTTRRFGGSGLGLAITRKLAQLMGGDVGCVSSANAGSTFWLEIPMRAASQGPLLEASASAALDGVNILVVEDNATNRMIVRKMLEQLGAGVTTAEDGEQGAEAALRGGFDLVLMDVQMPRLDGVGATRRIRADRGAAGQVPIIGLTANVLAHQRDEYLAAGMDAIVGKPISPATLLRAVVELHLGEGDELGRRAVQA